jgi:ankyrin repeat protein
MPNKNPADENGRTLIHWAALRAHLELVKLLLEHANDKNPADKDEVTSLHHAARNGLLEHAKDKNPADKFGN